MKNHLWLVSRIWLVCLLVGLATGLTLAALNHVAPARAAEIAKPAAGLQIVQSTEDTLVLELDVPAYDLHAAEVAQAYFQRITVDGATGLMVPGKPELPKFSALLGIPPHARATIRVLQDSVEILPGRYQLLPSAGPAPITGDLHSGIMQRVPDRTAYASSEFYPSEVARIVEMAWLRDQHLARLEVYPFQYLAATGVLRWHRHLRIEIKFEGGGTTDRLAAVPAADGPFEQMLRDTLLNYDVARQWRSNTAVPQSASRTAAATSRYEIVVDHDGLYRVTYSDLLAAGLVMTSFDPRNLHMTNQGRAVAVEVVGEGDGKFNPGDYLLFYGQRLRGDLLASKFISESAHWPALGVNHWQPTFNAFMVERYTDENAYWLSVENVPGLRMLFRMGAPSGTAPQAEFYTATVRSEQSKIWRTNTFTGEDPFFWESATASGGPVTRTFPITLSAAANTALSTTVRGDVVALTYSTLISPDHRTQFYLNSAVTPLEDQSWDGPTRHRFSGQVPSTALAQGVNSLRFVVMLQPGMVADTVLFDWFEVSYPRRFQAEQGQLLFNSDRTGPVVYNVTQLMTNSVAVLDVSNPWRPQHILSPNVRGSNNVFTASFELNQSSPVTIAVGDGTAWQKPKAITRYAPADDLRSPSNGADYIVITPRAFYTSSQTLAAYRAAQGLRVKVVDLNDVVNQFTDGIYHSIAIKAFLQYAYQNWRRPAPTYVVLVGDGHWNFKGYSVATGQGPVGPSPIYMPPHLVWVDPWQGEVDSSNALAAVSGDDILPDMLIGRLPVNSAAELDVIISKTIAYERAERQPWQGRLAFVADNTPDAAGDFVALSENAINGYAPSTLAIDRLYLDNYCPTPSGNPCPAINYALTKTLNVTGSLLVNYVGHASTNRWAHEQILVNADVTTLNNLKQLPVILSLDCLDGYWFHPMTTTQSALMELLLRAPKGGSVASFSPAGLGIATGHDVLQRGFYKALFDNGRQRLGSAALSAKLELFAAGHDLDLIDTFILFGDPALRLPTYSLALSPTSANQVAEIGSQASYALRVTNTAYLTDQVTISLTQGWPATVTPASILLAPGAAATFHVTITVPATAAVGAVVPVTVTVNSRGDAIRLHAQLKTMAFITRSKAFLPLVRRD